MTSKLIPANPIDVTVVRNVSDRVVVCSAPFLRFGRIRIGGRGTIVRLSSGALAVFSPTALTPEVRTKLESMGNDIKYIAALDMEHHIFVGEWYTAFPNAHVIGMEGLQEKRAKDAEMITVPFSTIFTPANKKSLRISDEFDRDFEYEYVDGHVNKELVFFFKPDKTLIEADLMFNLPATEQYSKCKDTATTGVLTRFFTSLQSTKGAAMGQRRFLWYMASGGNFPSFNTSVKRINSWDFQRIIPCHGDVIEQNSKGIFEKVFAWHLESKKTA